METAITTTTTPMSLETLKRCIYAIAAVTAATFVAAKVGEYGGAGVYGDRAGAIAWWTEVWPLIACGLFMLLQGIPGGRVIVTSPWSSQGDSWPLLIVLWMATPSAEFGSIAGPTSAIGSSGFRLMTLLTVLICMACRILQLHLGVRVGAVAPDRDTGGH